jgi:hypothetical protein
MASISLYVHILCVRITDDASESILSSKSDAIHRLCKAHTLARSLALTHYLSLFSLFLSLTLQPSRLSLPRWNRTLTAAESAFTLGGASLALAPL